MGILMSIPEVRRIRDLTELAALCRELVSNLFGIYPPGFVRDVANAVRLDSAASGGAYLDMSIRDLPFNLTVINQHHQWRVSCVHDDWVF